MDPTDQDGPVLPGPALMHQWWRDLTFLHWRVDADRVAPLLPAGTRPDVHDGSSWVGLIPFRLTDAGFGRGPALPYVGTLAETNVRLYSVDADGRPGVVFRSLDASRLAFVLGARAALGLPYVWARASVAWDGDVVTYRSSRRWPGPRGPRGASVHAVVRPGSETVAGDPLASFLTDRWALHARRLGRTLRLPNTHALWSLRSAELLELDETVLAAAGLPGLSARPPDSVLFSDGLQARFGGPSVVRG